MTHTKLDLIEALRAIPDNATLSKNLVGNLAVLIDDRYIGYLDLKYFVYVEVN